MSVPPRLSSLSTLPNGNGYRPQQQQQSQPRNGCSTKVWIERLLFVAIGVLASLGVVYHNRVTVSLGHIDHSEDYAVLPSSVEREKVRELINTKNSGMMDDQQRKRGERKNRLRALFASGKQQFFRVKYKDATEGTKEEVTATAAATATATALEEEEEKQRQKEIVVQQQEKELLEVQEVQRREREEEEEKQRQKEIVVQQQEKELLEVQEVQRREREKEEKLENVAAEKNSNKNADEEARTADSDETTSTTNTANTKDRLNIVLFYADDWTMKVLGKLNADVHTPNIDEMANNGMLFTNNCVTTSVCWMSRATLMTGVYSSRHRQSEPSAMGIYTTNPWSETLFPLLKKAGYYTGLVGKWHAPQPEEAMREAFDVQNFYYGEHVFDHFGTMRHVTDLNREHGMEFLQNRPRDKNFALKVSFFATHAWDGHYPSYVPMNGTREKYYPDNISIDQPKTATNEHWEDLPPFFTESNEGRNRWRRRFEPDYFQDNIKDLYSLATEVDSAIGEIIKVLKEQGVYDNTYLLFTTDNGNLHGEHGLTEKWYPFEESIRVPLVIQDPRMPKDKRGTTNGDWTLNIDLAPSLLGAANVPQSSFMQGKDMAHLYLPNEMMMDPAIAAEPWRKDWFYEYHMGNDPITAMDHTGKNWIDASFALVTNEWKYVLWPQHNYEQLFHRSLDPYDERDLLDQRKNYTQLQTTLEVYETMKARFAALKERAQSGHRV